MLTLKNTNLFNTKAEFRYMSKNFVGYKDVKNVRPLCLMLPKMSAYRKKFDEITYMSFSIKK